MSLYNWIYSIYLKLGVKKLPSFLFNQPKRTIYSPKVFKLYIDPQFSIVEFELIQRAIRNFEYFAPFFKFDIVKEDADFVLLRCISGQDIVKLIDTFTVTQYALGAWIPYDSYIVLVADRLNSTQMVTTCMHELGHAVGVVHVTEQSVMHYEVTDVSFFNKYDAKEFAKTFDCLESDFRYSKFTS
jgi:predicted Zn-dependent protease